MGVLFMMAESGPTVTVNRRMNDLIDRAFPKKGSNSFGRLKWSLIAAVTIIKMKMETIAGFAKLNINSSALKTPDKINNKAAAPNTKCGAHLSMINKIVTARSMLRTR